MARKPKSSWDLIPQMLRSAERTKKSSALAPHNWPLALATALVLGAGALHLASWVVACGVFAVGVLLISFAGTNLYFAIRNPDALRTEDYNLEKMALQNKLIGDDKKGLTEAVADDDLDRENAIDVGAKTLNEGVGAADPAEKSDDKNKGSGESS
jgi:hypothetical protein